MSRLPRVKGKTLLKRRNRRKGGIASPACGETPRWRARTRTQRSPWPEEAKGFGIGAVVEVRHRRAANRAGLVRRAVAGGVAVVVVGPHEDLHVFLDVDGLVGAVGDLRVDRVVAVV